MAEVYQARVAGVVAAQLHIATAMAITHNLRWVIYLSAASCIWAADARNGAMVLEQQGCQQCHAVRGQGLGHEPPQVARDLGERLAPTYGPHTLASALWNHTPEMWTQFSAQGVRPPAATETDWQDLFAYFYALQFSEPVGEVGRGKQVLETKRCTDCHSLTNASTGRAPSVQDWAHADDPVVLVYQLWNHASSMKNTFKQNKIEWKTLTGRDLMDLTAYVQTVQRLAPTGEFSLPAPETGKPLFDANCGLCHRDSMSLAMKLRNKNWMDIGADIWNHSQKMPTVRMVSPDDMRKLLAYVWQLQYDGPPGSRVLGQKAFVDKGCAGCHQGPINKGKPITAFSIVAAAWGPARQAHHRMLTQGVPWPNLSPADVANLVAYLNSPGPR
ncbi:MAG: cytochrome c [Acidobacteriia bacterium]|nr:cytochrome c [Terriglobia bacterium]